jgi:hypothetical protein
VAISAIMYGNIVGLVVGHEKRDTRVTRIQIYEATL